MRFEGRTIDEAMKAALSDPSCTMVNRNVGSGTRVLIDQLLGDRRPPGHGVQGMDSGDPELCRDPIGG